MSDSRDFDPRFDAAFQRGYVEGEASAPRQVSRPASVGLPPEPRPVVQEPLSPEAVARDSAGVAPQAHPEPVSLDGNPWVRVLWIIAAVFVVVGIFGQAWAQTLSSGSSKSSDAFLSFVIPSIAYSLCPAMIQMGFAALVGVVLLHAVRWRESR